MSLGTTSFAVQSTIVMIGRDWNLSWCNSVAGRSPAIIFDLSHPDGRLKPAGEFAYLHQSPKPINLENDCFGLA